MSQTPVPQARQLARLGDDAALLHAPQHTDSPLRTRLEGLVHDCFARAGGAAAAVSQSRRRHAQGWPPTAPSLASCRTVRSVVCAAAPSSGCSPGAAFSGCGLSRIERSVRSSRMLASSISCLGW